MTLLFIILGIVAAAILIFAVVFILRKVKFKPTQDKAKQLEKLNADLEPVGFAYEPKGDYFYSLMDAWQRKAGYCRLYDEASPTFNMIMDCEPITFSYGGKRWLIELWKGQYGITTGAEIGIYNTTRPDVQSTKFTGTFYEAVTDAERMPLSFVLRKNRKVLLKRSALHWWITAFKLGEFSETDTLIMDAKITFPNSEMCRAFTDALIAVGYTRREFSVRRTTVSIHYTTPHTKQPAAQEGVSAAVVQQTNKNNCNLFNFVTRDYPQTMDKLEYIKAMLPQLYHFFLHSLYSKALFDAFGWLLDLIHGKYPTPGPDPEPPAPTPCPPCRPCNPCGPCPPCPPCCPQHCIPCGCRPIQRCCRSVPTRMQPGCTDPCDNGEGSSCRR